MAIALGSNLGDRVGQLGRGVRAIAALPGVTLGRISSFVQTVAVKTADADPGGPYVNAVVTATLEGEATTDRAAWLLARLLEIEASLGRRREHGPGPSGGRSGAARTLDLDLVLFGGLVANEPARGGGGGGGGWPAVRVPHAGLADRAFVLMPLAQIAPEWLVPGVGGGRDGGGEEGCTVAALWARLGGREGAPTNRGGHEGVAGEGRGGLVGRGSGAKEASG